MKRKYWILLIIFILLLVLDQGTKLIIERYITPHSTLVVTAFLNITHVMNKGAAFSLMAEHQWAAIIFTIISSVAIVIILYYFRRIEEEVVLIPLYLSLILTGAVGNLIDRFRLGAVVDFLDLHYKGWHWPAFNVADASITIGVILLAINVLWEDKKQSKEKG